MKVEGSAQSLSASSTDVIDPMANKNDTEKLGELAQEFEAMFLDIMMKAMRSTIPKGEFLEKGNGEEIFQSMLDHEYTVLMADRQMTTIAASIEGELGSLVEATSKARELRGQSVYGIIDMQPALIND